MAVHIKIGGCSRIFVVIDGAVSLEIPDVLAHLDFLVSDSLTRLSKNNLGSNMLTRNEIPPFVSHFTA